MGRTSPPRLGSEVVENAVVGRVLEPEYTALLCAYAVARIKREQDRDCNMTILVH